MIRQFFIIVWNRRRANTLMLIELLVSFICLCGALTVICYTFNNWRQPMGFKVDNAWCLSMEFADYMNMTDEEKAAAYENIEQIELALHRFDEITALSSTGYNVPFNNTRHIYTAYVNGQSYNIDKSYSTPELIDVLKYDLIAGRWLEPGDEELNWVPVVLTKNLAELLFGDEDPIGKVVATLDKNGEPTRGEDDAEKRVVGMISDYRRKGKFADPFFCEFCPMPNEEQKLDNYPPANFVFQVAEGVPAQFEEEIIRTVQGIEPNWNFTVSVLQEKKSEKEKEQILPLLLYGIVVWFMVTMVGMGLVGVLWQNVTRRTRELGLRRALGASANQVRMQIMGELLAIATLAVIIGIVIFIQFPILQVFPSVGLGIYMVGLALSLAVVYPFVILCGLYPSWLATRINPVEALQYE